MKKLLVMTCAAVAAISSYADTAYLQASGSGNAAALTDASFWNPAIAPGDTAGASTDFIVQGGLKLKTATTTTSFQGKSLQLGASDFSSSGTVENDHSDAITCSDLRLYKGLWTYVNNCWQKLLGNATVHSPASDPFVFNYTGFSDGYMNMKLTGNESSAVRLTTWQGTYKGADTKPLFMQADQSQTYSGSWSLGQGVYLYMNAGSSSATVFGKPLTTFNPAALKVQKGVMLRYEVGNPRKWAASDNRGLTLDARNGVVTYKMTNRFAHDFEWPISGEGTFTIFGRGAFNMRAPCAVTLAVDNVTEPPTSLVLCSGASITGGLVLPENYVLPLETSSDRVTVHNLTTTNAMFKFPVSSDGTACAQLRLAGNVNVTGQIGLCFSTVPNVASEADIPVLVIDSSVARTFTAADFNPFGVPGAQTPNATGVKVVRNSETGDQIVYVTVVPYVKTSISQGNPNWGYFESWAWSGGVTPTAGDGKAYLTWDTHLSDKGEGQLLNVPCDRLILYNPTQTGFGFWLRHAKTVFPCLLVTDRTFLRAYSYWTGNLPNRGQPHEVAGNLEVQTTTGSEFELVAGRSQINVTATVTGNGTIRARSTEQAYEPPCMVTMAGYNTGYKGAFHAYNNIDAITNSITFRISSEENLGGNPLTFAPDALKLGYGCVFAPSAELTIDDANRGVTFFASTNLESGVWSGVTFDLANNLAVNSPVVWEQGLYAKTNSGTFAWGKGGTTVAAGVTLQVKDGAVKPQGFNALGAMTLTFSAGAQLAFDVPLAAGDSRLIHGVDMRNVTMTHTDSKLLVRLELDTASAGDDFTSATVPLATFATAATAQAFADAVNIKAPRGYGAKLLVSEASVDGAAAATLSVSVAKRGLVISIQ